MNRRHPRRAALNHREVIFVDKYIETLHVTASARAAGYKHPGSDGFKLLRRPAVQAAIEIRRMQVTAEAGVTPAEVIRRMMHIGFADPAELLDEEGRLKALRSMPKELRLALASVKVLKVDVEITETEEGEEPKVRTETTTKLVECKFWDKPKMLHSLAEHLNLFGGGRPKDRLEDLSLEELERMTAATEAALAAITGSRAETQKVLKRAMERTAAEEMAAPAPKPGNGSGGNGAKKNGKGNGHA